ncbi:hypothetical protein [Lacticaseibacillus thailandensis]|uniref:Uncharacterized protein n=1 Tax=Lacticaseibacillus thailandensis DSM 22698 = JCM 13996 TaxID=1423810 RepID=A0A0R2C6S2_9LACO|nr:hypothetical protein [Lacticaseibacillus thailandensis]KRM87567.1 hypothetical protein FD19_GL001079 [Lacticaseibacillus thailandensis DSM 22698 = JCM 13996]
MDFFGAYYSDEEIKQFRQAHKGERPFLDKLFFKENGEPEDSDSKTNFFGGFGGFSGAAFGRFGGAGFGFSTKERDAYLHDHLSDDEFKEFTDAHEGAPGFGHFFGRSDKDSSK